jgi:hypothetical protein
MHLKRDSSLKLRMTPLEERKIDSPVKPWNDVDESTCNPKAKPVVNRP